MKPNFLFIIPDQQRADWLGINPDLPLHTPNIKKLVLRGVNFTNAFTPSPLCSPARACLATGRAYHRCGVVNNLDSTPVSLVNYYRQLRDIGYEVAAVGKLDLHKPDHAWGLDGTNLLDQYGFTTGVDCEGKGDAIISYRQNNMAPKGPYMQFLEEKGLAESHVKMYKPYLHQTNWMRFPAVIDLPDDAYCDNWVAAHAKRILQGFPSGKPWHLAVNFVGPHFPFDVTSEMREKWKNVAFPMPIHNTEADIKTIKTRRQNYAAMIENIDAHLGALIGIVEQRGELENTYIIFSSDHGEMLGDHNHWGKAVWYNPSSKVPLVCSGPGVAAGVSTDALVSLHDLSATMLDLAGAESIPGADARSIRPVLEGNVQVHREFVLSGLDDQRGKWDMIFDGQYKLVVSADRPSLLYDVLEDPDESENIIERYPFVVKSLSSKLNDVLRKT